MIKLQAKRFELNFLLKLSDLKSNFTLTLCYLNPVLNNLGLVFWQYISPTTYIFDLVICMLELTYTFSCLLFPMCTGNSYLVQLDSINFSFTFCSLFAKFIVKTTCWSSKGNLCGTTMPHDWLIQKLKFSSCAKIICNSYKWHAG